MCDPKLLQMVRDEKAFVFRKTSFFVATSITLLSLIASIVISFTTVRLKAETNACDISQLADKVQYIEEIRYNLRNLCEKQGVTYIERAK